MRSRACVLLALLAGCGGVRPCKSGTALVAVTFDAASAAADNLVVQVSFGGQSLSDRVAHTPGVTSGSLELDFPSYPDGQSANVVVTAVLSTRGDAVIGEGRTTQTLATGCASFGLDVHQASVPDLGASDGSRSKTCQSAGDCPSAHCVDGVCCNTSCDGQCEACDVAGSAGTCSAVTSGQPHGKRTPCAGANTACGGSCAAGSTSACTFPGASTSCRAASCTGSTKTIAAVCDGVGNCPMSTVMCPSGCNAAGTDCMNPCKTDADCTSSSAPYCNSGACLATKPAGAQCAMPGECTTNFCVDSHCCNTSSCGSCKACSSTGSCQDLASGAADSRCGSSPPCGATGLCDGNGNCANTAANTACGTTSVCSADNLQVSKSKICDGSGACVQAPFVSCSPYLCSGSTTNGGCFTNCGSCDSPVPDACGSNPTKYCAAGHQCVITDFCCSDPSCTCQPYHCQ